MIVLYMFITRQKAMALYLYFSGMRLIDTVASCTGFA